MCLSASGRTTGITMQSGDVTQLSSKTVTLRLTLSVHSALLMRSASSISLHSLLEEEPSHTPYWED